MAPTFSQAPSQSPTRAPVGKPSFRPTIGPTSRSPTTTPTTRAPTVPTAPTMKPTVTPTSTSSPSVAPTRIPTVDVTNSPTKAPDGSGWSYNKDYTCYHAYSWMENTNKLYSTNIGTYTDIVSSGYLSSRRQLHEHTANNEIKTESTLLTTGWKVTFTGVPSYTRNFSSWDMSLISNRPNYNKDFGGSSTKAKVGTTYNFGDNIGYKSTQCTLGFWPPGPDCPEALSGEYVFPVEPAPESSNSKRVEIVFPS